MTGSPMLTMLDDLISKLKYVVIQKAEAEKMFSHYSTAIKALIPLCEDEEARAEYANALDEITGKPGFLDAVRQVLKSKTEPLTPSNIRFFITMGKKLDLTQYSNPMASIHTTLRRMKNSGEVEETVNDKNEKVFRLRTIEERMKSRATASIATPPVYGSPNSFASEDAKGRGGMEPVPTKLPKTEELRRITEKLRNISK